MGSKKHSENNHLTVKAIKGFSDNMKTEKSKTNPSMVRKKLRNTGFKEEARNNLKNHDDNAGSFTSKAKVSTKNTSNVAMTQPANPRNKPKSRTSKPRQSNPQVMNGKTYDLKKKRLTARIKKFKNNY